MVGWLFGRLFGSCPGVAYHQSLVAIGQKRGKYQDLVLGGKERKERKGERDDRSRIGCTYTRVVSVSVVFLWCFSGSSAAQWPTRPARPRTQRGRGHSQAKDTKMHVSPSAAQLLNGACAAATGPTCGRVCRLNDWHCLSALISSRVFLLFGGRHHWFFIQRHLLVSQQSNDLVATGLLRRPQFCDSL